MSTINTWFRVAKNVVTDYKTKIVGVSLAAGACAAVAAGSILAVGAAVTVAAVGFVAHKFGDKVTAQLPSINFIGYVNDPWDKEDIERYVEKLNFKSSATNTKVRDVLKGVPFTEREELFKYIAGTDINGNEIDERKGALKELYSNELTILQILNCIADLPADTRVKVVKLLKELGFNGKGIKDIICLLTIDANISYVSGKACGTAILTALEQLKSLGFKGKEITADILKALKDITDPDQRANVVDLVNKLKLPKEDILKAIQGLAAIVDVDGRITIVNMLNKLDIPEKDRWVALEELINITDEDQRIEAVNLIHKLGLAPKDVIVALKKFSEKCAGLPGDGIAFFKQLGEQLIKPIMTSEQKKKVLDIFSSIPVANRIEFINNVKTFAANDDVYYEMIESIPSTKVIKQSALVINAIDLHQEVSKDKFPQDPKRIAKLFKINNDAIQNYPDINAFKKYVDQTLSWRFDKTLKKEAFEILAKSTEEHRNLITKYSSKVKGDEAQIKFWKAVNAIPTDKITLDFKSNLEAVFNALNGNQLTRILVYLADLLAIDLSVNLIDTLKGLAVWSKMTDQDLQLVLQQLKINVNS